MPRSLNERLGPWLGSAVIHIVFIVVLAAAALRWRSDPPAEQLAIEGSIVRYEDLPRTVRSGRPLKEPQPAPVPPVEVAQPAPEPEPEPEAERAPVREATPPRPDAGAKQKQEQLLLRQQQEAARLSAQREKEAVMQRAAETKAAAAAAEEKRKAEATLNQQQEALAAKQRQQEKEQAVREARLKAEREAELNRALASEEAGEAFARSGVTDEYRALLIQAIERNWIRPPSARPGLECTLYVTQAPGGTVIDVKIGECNGDQAVRESVANAVYRSSPLPPPRDPRAFERRLVMTFKPTE